MMDGFVFRLILGGVAVLRLILIVHALATGRIRAAGGVLTRDEDAPRFRFALASATFATLVMIAGLILFPVPGHEDRAPFLAIVFLAEFPPQIAQRLVYGPRIVAGIVPRRFGRPFFWVFLVIGIATCAASIIVLGNELGAFALPG
jgi:hypothetical protein